MKTLKITLMLVAVLFLTVSGVKSEDVVVNDENTTTTYKTDLLAHTKKGVKLPSNG